ncbi:RNA recognition motif-containing protein isoform 1 [Tanacetum coccineum]
MTSTSDRAWMYKMTDTKGYSNQTYVQNVELFLDFAYSNHEVVEHMSTMSGEIELRIKCPCKGVNGSARQNGSENGSAGTNGSVGSVASTSIGVGELNEVGESSGGQAVKPRWVNDKSRDHMEKYQAVMVESHGEDVESHPHNAELWNKVKVSPGVGVGESEQEGIVKDMGDGSYTITYVVLKRGNYMLSVECDGRPIMGSPFRVLFSAGTTTVGLLGLAPQMNYPHQ